MGDDPGLDGLAQRLSGAQRDAARIADELVSRGHLSAEQATALRAAVGTAVGQGRELLAAAWREPRRVVRGLRESVRALRGDRPSVREEDAASAAPGSTGAATTTTTAAVFSDLLRRLDRLEARLEVVERSLERGSSRPAPAPRPPGTP